MVQDKVRFLVGEQNHSNMEERQLIFKTREGVSLYFDGVLLYTENIKVVLEALRLDSLSMIGKDITHAKEIVTMLQTYPLVKGEVTVKTLSLLRKFSRDKKGVTKDLLSILIHKGTNEYYKNDIETIKSVILTFI